MTASFFKKGFLFETDIIDLFDPIFLIFSILGLSPFVTWPTQITYMIP